MTGIVGRERAQCEALLGGTDPVHNRTGSSLFEDTTIITSAKHAGCSAHFDKSLCWQSTDLGAPAHRSCPFAYCSTVPDCARIEREYNVQRTCQLNGTWSDPNYSQCLLVIKQHPECIVGYCRSCPDLLRDLVINVSLALSIISVALLVTALVLFSLFANLQCRRLSIHKNLACAFVLRFAVLAAWTLLQTSNAFQSCSSFVPVPLMHLEWICKLVIWLVIYFQVASVMWMLIEGAYLYTRFTVLAMRHSDAPYALYLAGGWGFPLCVVLAWTGVHEYKSRQMQNSFCWLPYAQGAHLWILSGTMGVALVLNLLFLLFIVVILVQKLRAENTAESRKIWRTIKSTLLLVPLLGISNIPLFYEPPEPSGTYMLGSAILQHSQGIFIAVLYCFCNGEIQTAIKSQLLKVPIFNRFRNLKTRKNSAERTYVPTDTVAGDKQLGVPMLELTKSRANTPPVALLSPHAPSSYSFPSAPPVESLSTARSPTRHPFHYVTQSIDD